MKPNQIFSHWKQIRADLLSTIDKFDNDELVYAPFETSWCVGQIVLHIANAEEGWFRYAVSRELDKWPEQYRPENYPTKKDVKLALSKVHTHTEQYLDSLDEANLAQLIEVPWDESIPLIWIIWHVVEHEIHHRGELSLILGLLGREGLDL
jgi:uncharacterized damage-inducible protein DinB